MKRAVIYARYSSDMQREKSIEDQLRECHEYADRNGYSVVREYIDRAQSARTDKRLDFQRMISDSESESFDIVLVYKFDRFARNRLDSCLYKHRLMQYNVKVVSIMEPIVEGAAGAFQEAVMEAVGEWYSLDLSEKFKRGKRGTALKCKHTGGRPLLGYKVAADGTYEIDEAGAATVRLLFELYANGYSYTRIIEECNARGMKTGAGNPFGKGSLHDLLKNERYIGVYTYNKIPSAGANGKRNCHAENTEDVIRIEDGIPAIIDKTTWDKVQQRMAENKHRAGAHKNKYDYLLSGKLFCGKCGSAMVGKSSVNSCGTEYQYYECARKRRQRTCDKRNVKCDEIESYVVESALEFLRTVDVDRIAAEVESLTSKSADDTDIQNTQKLIAEKEKEVANFVDAIRQGVMSSYVKDALDKTERELSVLRALLEEQKISVAPVISAELTKAWYAQFIERDPHDSTFRRDIIRYFVNQVWLFDDGGLLMTFTDGEEVQRKVSFDAVKDCWDLESVDSSAPMNPNRIIVLCGLLGILRKPCKK